MNIKIRRANNCDRENFVKLCLGLTMFNTKFNSHNRLEKITDEEREARRIEKAGETFDIFIKENKDLILIATLNDEPVGYLTANFISEQVGYLDELFVDKKARKLGIGRLLLTEGSKWVRENGGVRVSLNVYSWNESAIKIYEQMGFRGYYRNYIMDI